MNYIDAESWMTCLDDDLWIFDKLILSRKLGYVCGPAGAPIPDHGIYIVRPITNIDGMGRGAYTRYFKKGEGTSDLSPGTFWCEMFTGEHVSIDYLNREPILTVVGEKDPLDPLWRFTSWKKVENNIGYPDILLKIKGNYPKVNVEMIGGNIIEIHLRHNPDWNNHKSEMIIPVWNDQKIMIPPGWYYKEDRDFNRQGFYIKG